MPGRGSKGKGESRTLRASISFPAATYHELERIAEAKKVSLAWVVRDAAERYIEAQWPLLEKPRNEQR